MNDEASFLDAIKANPRDRALRLVYADWLEECGDARAEYLRVDAQLQERVDSAVDAALTDPKVRQLRAQLKKMAPQFDPEWVSFFAALRPNFVRCRVCQKVINAADAIQTNPRNYRKTKSSRYCKLCFEDAVRAQIQQGFNSPGRSSRSSSDYLGGGRDDE